MESISSLFTNLKEVQMKKSIVLLLLVAVVTVCAWSAGKKEEAVYPAKPITVLQGFQPGGGSDQLAQLAQPFLEKILGKTFVNQYIPGATGGIAWTQLAKQSPKDAYTISITNTPMLMTNYIMNPEMKYSIKELDPIANVVTDPGVIVVGKDSPYKTAQEFFAAVKANPGKITAANSGVGGDDFFTTLITEKATGLKFQMVPFSGDGPSWQSAAGLKTDSSFNNLGVTYPQLKAGMLRALVIFSDKRDASIPDVPTMKELGFNVISGSSRGYSAPKGIPQAAKDKLIAAFAEMGKNPEFAKAAAERALPVDIKLGKDYEAYLSSQESAFVGIWDEVKSQYTKK